MIRRERWDGGRGEQRGFEKWSRERIADREKTDKRELCYQIEEEDKEH